jgi:hypothetical protein
LVPSCAIPTNDNILERVHPWTALVRSTVSIAARTDKLSILIVAVAVCANTNSKATNSSDLLWWADDDVLEVLIGDTIYEGLLANRIECALGDGIVVWGINDIYGNAAICITMSLAYSR